MDCDKSTKKTRFIRNIKTRFECTEQSSQITEKKDPPKQTTNAHFENGQKLSNKMLTLIPLLIASREMKRVLLQ